MASHQDPGGGGWAAAGPPPPPPPPPQHLAANIQYWKQHQQQHQQQQQQQHQQQQQLQQQHQQQQQQKHQQQQPQWCEPAAGAAERPASPPANLVTTVTVPGWPACGVAAPPSSPRCESARSDAAESSCSSLSQESLSPPARPAELARSVTAPAHWNRVTRNGLVVYVSPSGVSLTSVEEARQYLRTDGTCKCGLECPLILEKSFNFDPKVITRPRNTAGCAVSPSGATKTCNHRRKRTQLLPHPLCRKGVPPTFQEQRCNPHNNPFFKEQMMQAMEQMNMQHQQHQLMHHQQQLQHQQQLHQQHRLQHLQQQQQQQQLLQPRFPEQHVPAAPGAWPRAAPPSLSSPQSARPAWEEQRRRRQAARGRRRAPPGRGSPCPNVDVRQLEGASPPQPPAPPTGDQMPSFLDDPSGYLAQQTQLLNDTLQEGLSPVPPAPEASQAQAATVAPVPAATEAAALPGAARPPEPAASQAQPPPSQPAQLPPPPPAPVPAAPDPAAAAESPPGQPSLAAASPAPPTPATAASESVAETASTQPSPLPVASLAAVSAAATQATASPPAVPEPTAAAAAAASASAAAAAAAAVAVVSEATAPTPASDVVQGAVTSAQHPSAAARPAPLRPASSRAAAPAPVRASVTATPTTVMATPRAPTATRPSAASQARRATPPALAPAPPPPAPAQYQVLGQPDLNLVQSLPAGQIILPSGQVILTQPLQPMVQYVNAFPMQNQLLLPSGGLLQVEEPRPAAPPAGRRRRRKPASGTVASILRGQAPPPASAAAPGIVGGMPTFLLGGKSAPLVLSAGQPGMNLLQPVLLPGGGGQVFIQNVPAPLLSAAPVFPASAAPQAAGGQLLQVVSVLGDAAGAAPAPAPLPPPPPPPPAVVQTPADSSTPDAAWQGRGSPPTEAGLVSSTVEPADSEADPDDARAASLKRKRPEQDDAPASGFAVGDLVWGSNQGLDSWPGQVIQRTDVQPCPADRVWVRWFGDHTMALQPVASLRKFHTHNTTKHKKSLAVNSSFEEALQEALTAVNRQRN